MLPAISFSISKTAEVLLCLCLFFMSEAALSFEQEIHSFIVQQETQLEKNLNIDLQELYDYKKEVERTAYTTTLQLCEGYRRALSLGPHPYHGKYMYSLKEAAQAWTQLAYEGAQQPLSAIFGIKGHYIDKKSIGFFDFDFWFKSMYTSYLVNSMGFLAAAMHCLDVSPTDKSSQKKINRFAATIIIVDYEMSLLTHAATFWGFGKVFSLIAQSTRLLWRPVGKAISSVASRVGKSKIILGGVAIGGVSADSFFQYIKKRETVSSYLQEALDSDSEYSLHSHRRGRFLMLSLSFNLFYRSYSLEKKFLAVEKKPLTCQQAKDLYTPFAEYFQESFTKKQIRKISEDHARMKEKQSRTPNILTSFEKKYLELLDAFWLISQQYVKKSQKTCDS